jgi:hypothetical protein
MLADWPAAEVSVEASYFRSMGNIGSPRLGLDSTQMTHSGGRRSKLFALRDAPLLDHLICGGQQRLRDGKAEGFGGLVVN